MRFAELVSDVEARIAEDTSDDSFLTHMPELFEHVLASGAYKKALNDILAAIRDHNKAITARHTAGQFIALHSTPWSNWSIIYHKDPARFLYLAPVDALQAPVGGSELSVGRFSCTRPVAFDMLQRDLELRDEGHRTGRRGEVFTRRGREEILDWSVAATAARPGVTLRVNSGPLDAFEWAFDRATMRAVGLSPIDPIESNLSTVFTLLAAVGERSSVEQLLPFLGSKRHFVRWNALQAIGALDEAACAEGLRCLADDPHPEVRKAARRALEPSRAAA